MLHRIEPKTKQFFNTFKTYPDFNRTYWRGTHRDAMAARLDKAVVGTIPSE
jgi:uncharacterized protein with PIN domain